MKGMLASRHRKQLSSSVMKEPIRLKCQYTSNSSTGTTPTKRLTIYLMCSQAIATDAEIFLENLDSTLFPGVSTSVLVHTGFSNEQAK